MQAAVCIVGFSLSADESIPGFPEAYLCCDWAPRAPHSTTYWSWAVPTAAPLLGGPQDFKTLKNEKDCHFKVNDGARGWTDS